MADKVVTVGEASAVEDAGEMFDAAVPDEAGVSAMTELMQKRALVRQQAIVKREAQAGEVVLSSLEETVDVYRGASEQAVTAEQAAILAEPIPEEELEILPTGEVYASQVRYRRVLNRVFGPMGWALRPLGEPKIEGNTVARHYGLYAAGRFISEEFGEQDYDPKNARASYATALTSVKSNALMRCCKDLGIASECWDRRFTEKWIEKFAVAAWCVGVADFNRGKKKKLWRRKDAKPFEFPWAEQETVGGAKVAAALAVEDENQDSDYDDRVPAQEMKAKVPADGFQAITRTHSKPTKKAGVTRYAVQLEDGLWYSTFDAKDGEKLMGMKGQRVMISSRVGEFGHEIIDFVAEEAG